LAATLTAGGLAASPPASAEVALGPMTNVSAGVGARTGELTIRWQHDGSATAFRIEAAASSFLLTKQNAYSRNRELPRLGRRYLAWTVPGDRRSFTLSAQQTSAVGASAASGNLVYYRVAAVKQSAASTVVRYHPDLRAALPRPAPPKSSGTPLRVATFNVRTAKVATDRRTWLQRAPDVAREIVRYQPGIVALQELSPGRADGQKGSAVNRLRQTTSLEQALAGIGWSRYQLIRETSYVKSGTATGTQGTRILYDTSRYSLVTKCPETISSKSPYSPSCTIKLPVLPELGETERRHATYAEFADRKTGKRFFVVSAHLDNYHSSDLAKERRFETQRGKQVLALTDAMAKLNPNKVPVVFGADLNSWQNNRVADDAHELLTEKGYYDTSSALQRINMEYGTANGFRTTVVKNPQGVGSRLDVLAVYRGSGAKRTENVMQVTSSSRPSDHNMVVSDVVL